MAAYAALISLTNNIQSIHNHPHLSPSFDKNQIESLSENLGFFLDFVETCNSYGDMSKEEVEALEAQIASAVHAAEDVIESHVSDQILTAYSGQCPPSFLDDSHFLWVAPKITFLIKKMALKVAEKCRLQTVKIHLKRIATEMDMIKKRVMEVKKKRGLKDQQVESAMAEASSSETLTTGNTTSVGFNDYLLQLLNWLTGQQSDRQIIPITGMGGIGKTTLARNAYENSLIVQHFYVHAWVTVSQEFNKKKVFLEILCCLRANTSGNETEEELGEKLYKILSGRRYLIVLDDMWCTDDWDKIHLYFPNNGNGSRIVVTTRICNVGSYFGSLGLALSLLDDDQSWTLFCEKVFGQEGCPLELKKLASMIVKKCRGLPLSIVVIGGLLRNSSREVEHWEYVAKDLSSILSSGEGNQCLNVLFLSYSHLPVRLKPCFLYFGMFSEDHEICVSHLIKLWVAEEFLKSNKEQNLEEDAEGFVKDLIDRNLILVSSMGSNGKVKTCKVHDLVRDLCVMVGEKEKFFYAMEKLETPHERGRERRIGFMGRTIGRIYSDQMPNEVFLESSILRSFVSRKLSGFSSNSRLRVLFNAYASPDTVFQQVNLRFLPSYPINVVFHGKSYQLPSSISLLWNLQTLVIAQRDVRVDAPPEIWEMLNLDISSVTLLLFPTLLRVKSKMEPFYPTYTLKRVCGFRFSEEACKRMPNIKKLYIFMMKGRVCPTTVSTMLAV